jgi:hypothetical protein
VRGQQLACCERSLLGGLDSFGVSACSVDIDNTRQEGEFVDWVKATAITWRLRSGFRCSGGM